MQRERYQFFRKPIAFLYVISFFLPVGGIRFPGLLCFIFSALVGLSSFNLALLIGWAANPLGWMGLFALKKGRFDRAAACGIGALVASLAPCLFVVYFIREAVASNVVIGLMQASGYFAWVVAFLWLAVVAVLAAGTNGSGRFLPQLSIGWLAIAIVFMAYMIANWSSLLHILYGSLPSGRGMPTPG